MIQTLVRLLPADHNGKRKWDERSSRFTLGPVVTTTTRVTTLWTIKYKLCISYRVLNKASIYISSQIFVQTKLEMICFHLDILRSTWNRQNPHIYLFESYTSFMPFCFCFQHASLREPFSLLQRKHTFCKKYLTDLSFILGNVFKKIWRFGDLMIKRM